MRAILSLGTLMLLIVPVDAQQHPELIRAQQAYDNVEFRAVLPAVRAALRDPNLSIEDRIVAYELLGFTYGAFDSTTQAVEAFRNLIFLDPDREPDAVRVSPRITSLYASALGQVLVVRNVRMDSTSFIGANGTFPIRFDVSRPGSVFLRAVGRGSRFPLDSAPILGGSGRFEWDLLSDDGVPVPAGVYQIMLEVKEGPDQYETSRAVEVRHAPVDTLPHLVEVPGRTLQAEMRQPGRNWRPLGLAALYTAFASGASLALESTALGKPARREIGGISFAVLVTGLIMSLKKPDPVPVPGNILYNELLRDELARLNAGIAAQNLERRRQVRITVVPVGSGH